MLMRDPLEAVVRAHRDGKLPQAGQRLVVGFSGGPDSCALLHALSRSGLFALVAVHVDHGMRAESGADAAAAVRLAAGWGVACRVVRLERVPRSEVEARSARHRVLAAAANGAIALGHTADDQVETLLMRITRGTGISGLRGMREWEPGPAGVFIARPLLGLSRTDIVAYLDRHAIIPIEDPTNADPAFADRNRVRLGAVPALRALNPRLAEAVARLSQLAEEDDAALEEWATRELAACQIPGTTATLPIKALLALPVALRRRILRRLAPDLSFEQVEQVLGLAGGKSPGHTHLPGGHVAIRAKGRLEMRAGPPPDRAGCRICLTQDGLIPSMERELGN
jgi:tRNA(Ile)-lysidine synthase